MDPFKLKYLEEASDLIDGLEKLLLKLEGLNVEPSHIEEIFRVMHTIKGSSFMFGFETIGEFTHDLETIYDQIRNNERSFTSEILDVTLASTDHIRTLLSNDNNISNEPIKQTHESLLKKIKSIIGNTEVSVTTPAKPKAGNENTYYVYFKPEKSILARGGNPVYILQDLSDLGSQSKVLWHLHDVPDIHKMDFQECYTYWEVFLATTASEQDIKDVFLFADDGEIEVELIAGQNLFLSTEFKTFLQNIPENQAKADLEQLREVAKKIISATDTANETLCFEAEQSNKSEGKLSSIRVSSDKLENLMNLVSELVTTQARLSLYAQNNFMQSELHTIAENIEKISRQLRDNTLSICLIPIESLTTRFQRLIRDVSKQLNKEVIFISEGTDTEIDKTIIDIISDPLMHILRNSLDHGIESSERREKNGKPKKGTIVLRAFYSGTNVHIEISDDGGGIDTEKVREKAIKKGLLSPEAVLNEKEIFDLIFLPGFSTAEAVSEISGRGVGMDVVKRQIASVRGIIEVQSTLNEGTTIVIKLPLTLSIIDGLLVHINGAKYVIPLTMVVKCYEVTNLDTMKRLDNLIELDGTLIPFFNLREQLEDVLTAPDIQKIVLVKQNGKHIGIVVDDVMSEYQAVLKPLGALHKNNEYVSGATILGDGSIALVLDINQLIKTIHLAKV